MTTPPAPCVPNPSGLSALRDAAGFYSQLSGVLAGFAFAGLVALIAARIGARSSYGDLAVAYRPTVSAFVCLVAASMSFALAAGDPTSLGRASSLETAAGLGFAAAVLTLLYSLLVLLHAVERDVPDETGQTRSAFSLLQRAFVVLVCPLTVLVFSAGMHDHIRLRTGTTTGLQGLDVASLAAVGAVLVVGLLARRFATRMRERRPSAPDRLPALSMGMALVAVGVSTVVVIAADPCRPSPDLLPATELALVAIFAAAAAVTAARLD
ncbi:hypothetical protein ACR9E3_09405 [Actinomycetospora sp. C-140]